MANYMNITNIDISTFSNYFSLTVSDYNQNPKNALYNCQTQSQTIIVKHDDQIVNETNIAEQISQIPYYSLFFSILEDYNLLNITQTDNKEKYYLFKYANKYCVPMMEYLYSITNIKQLLFISIHSFSYLLHSLSLLHNNNICFLNISPENIVYQTKSGEKPLLNNFRFSIILDNINIKTFMTCLNGLNNFTYQPLEIYILYYLIKHNMNTISYSFIEEFCETFISNLHILKLEIFTEKYKQSYKEQCIYIIKKYVNKPKNEIIQNIWSKRQKWDIYGISVIYIQIFYSICHTFSLKQTFLNEIVFKLSLNLHPDSNCRMTLERTIQTFNELFDKQRDWNFVNQLDNSSYKMEELFETFSN